MKLTRLLLTGSAGGLGKVLRPRLAKYAEQLRISDINELGAAAENEEIDLCDLGDFDAVARLVKGVDMIVHLGGVSLDGPFEPILNANIRGVYNLYEASRIAGVRRIIFASSNHVIGFHKQTDRLDDTAALRPDGNYGVSKAFGELLSRFYFDRYGFESVCVRIGSSFPKALDRRMLSTWLSYDDLDNLIGCCIRAPSVGHTVIYGASDNRPAWWDNTHAEFLGWKPVDSSDQFREEVMKSPPLDPTDPAAIYQGGGFVKFGPYPPK
jgi:uronate dehydrogenase